MEYPCHRCGSPVEEGTRFCPACSAPQIRVSRPEPAISRPAQEKSLIAEPATRSAFFRPPAENQPAERLFEWRHAWRAAGPAGATMGALSAMPFLALLFPLWMFAAGALAVILYRKRTGIAALRAGLGMRLGALAGSIAFAVYGLLFSLSVVVLRSVDFREQLRDLLAQRMLSTPAPDPQTQQLMQWFLTPAGLTTIIAIGMGLLLVGFILVGAAAGALWAAMRNPRVPS